MFTVEQLKIVETKMFGRIAESPYIIVLNGELIKYRNKPVQVALRNKVLSFFIKEASQEYPVDETRRQQILLSFLDNYYGEHDFTEYILNKQKQAASISATEVEDFEFLIPVPQIDNTLRMFIIETHIFALIKNHEERTGSGSLVLKDGTGEILNNRQLTTLRNFFITQCITNNIEMGRLVFIGRISRVLDHPIFAASGEMFMAMIKHRHLHNPWIDNVRLVSTVSAYPLFVLLNRRLRMEPRSQLSQNVITNLQFAFITHAEASAHLGLTQKFPFSYTIFRNILAGLVLLPAEHNYKFPSREINVFVYTGDASEREQYDTYLSPAEYLKLSEVDQELYSMATTLLVLVNSHEAFFKTKGISETRTRLTKNMRLYEILLRVQLQIEDVWSEAQ